MEFTFSADVLEFIKWLKFEVLKELCTDSDLTPYPKALPTQYWFASKSMPYLTNLKSLWYVESNNILTLKTKSLARIKVLPDDTYLSNYFTEVALAFLIMGDGYWENDSNTVFICTDNFSLDEVKRLISFLEMRFSLKCTVKKRTKNTGNTIMVYYRIRFSSTTVNLNLLKSLVVPHMHPSMLYKLGP